MSHVNMKYLRTFLVMVEEKSSAKTARRLGMHQVSVLNNIGRLEETVGKHLLERAVPPKAGEAGRTQLTEAGRAFLPKAIEAMRAHDRMFDDKSLDLDPRMVTGVTATLLQGKALAVLKHDLSEEERDGLHEVLASCCCSDAPPALEGPA